MADRTVRGRSDGVTELPFDVHGGCKECEGDAGEGGREETANKNRIDDLLVMFEHRRGGRAAGRVDDVRGCEVEQTELQVGTRCRELWRQNLTSSSGRQGPTLPGYVPSLQVILQVMQRMETFRQLTLWTGTVKGLSCCPAHWPPIHEAFSCHAQNWSRAGENKKRMGKH